VGWGAGEDHLTLDGGLDLLMGGADEDVLAGEVGLVDVFVKRKRL